MRRDIVPIRHRLVLSLRQGIAGLALLIAASLSSRADSIAFRRTTAAGVPVMILQVDMNNPYIKVTGMVTQNGHAEPFDAMIRRSHPTAAFPGTYFSLNSLAPVGDIVIGGSLANQGGIGTGLCVTPDNGVEFLQPPYPYAPMDWSAYDFVCAAGPRLVAEGKVSVHPRAEGFRDPHLLGRASRLAVGITRHNKLLFVATRNRIRLGQMARAMQKLGCIEAINLDAGSSLGFYHHGKTEIRPQRKLTNLILVYDDRERYAQYKAELASPLSLANNAVP